MAGGDRHQTLTAPCYRVDMRANEPLQLNHSWPLVEQCEQFALGTLHDADPIVFAALDRVTPEAAGIGAWQCRLADASLSWTDPIYDLFGLPRGSVVARADTLALYAEESRAAMERLRDHAIRHRRGFTLDAAIATTGGERRWMRLIAAPRVGDGIVTELFGLKQDVTHLYR